METSSSSVKANKMAVKRVTKVEAPVVVPTPAPAAVAAPVQAAPVETRSADEVLSSLQETLKTLKSELSSKLAAVSHELVEVSKAVKRELRNSKRRRKVDPATLSPEERTAWEARRKNNAFLKMRPLTDEMCTFMGIAAKSQRSQTDVTKFVSSYVKQHSCFDPSFKRRILPDAKLAKLLRTKDKDEVTYLNLQKYLKVHYLKTA
jgi:chromatin remodeling complex protein RSC6